MEDLVSIVIPTLRSRKELLERAIKSVMNQTYQHIEIIPIEGGRNASDARNIGIKRARGKYIAFLDDDDEWLPTKIEQQLKEFEEDTKLVICWIDDRRFGERYIVRYKNKLSVRDVLRKFNLASTSAYMFRADFLKKELFDVAFVSAQEYELAIRAILSAPVKCVQSILVIQNKSSNQITRNWKKKKQGLKQLLIKHKNLYSGNLYGNYWVYRLKFFGLQCLYSLAYVVGDRIYKIIIPLKRGF